MRVRHGGGVQAGRDQAREMGHVDHQVRADFVCDAPEFGEIELPRVGGPAGQDELRPALAGDALDLGHVDAVVVFADVVRGDVVELAGEVELHAVREVAAVRQIEPEDGVAGGEQRRHRRGVGLRPRMWLHVGIFGAEQALYPVDGELLGDVHEFAAAVVPAARVALGVLVGQHRALRLHHRDRREVLAGDHLQRALLTVQFGGDGLVHFGIQVCEADVQRGVRGRRCGVEGHLDLSDIAVCDGLIYQL